MNWNFKYEYILTDSHRGWERKGEKEIIYRSKVLKFIWKMVNSPASLKQE